MAWKTRVLLSPFCDYLLTDMYDMCQGHKSSFLGIAMPHSIGQSLYWIYQPYTIENPYIGYNIVFSHETSCFSYHPLKFYVFGVARYINLTMGLMNSPYYKRRRDGSFSNVQFSGGALCVD